MCNIQMKLKNWIKLIKSGNFENIIEDIMTNNYFQSDGNSIISNKDLFKLILHLAHAANDCDKQKYKEGRDIGNLASLLCSNLSTIPDNERFTSSLYHIIRCLLRMNLYEEAENLSSYLIRDNFECIEDKINEIFRQLTYLWHESAEKELLSLQRQPNHRKHYDRYKNAIKYELLITKKSYKNLARHFIIKLSVYLRKLIAIKNISNEYINDFIKYIINEDYEHMSINKNDKHKIYSSILNIIGKLICTNINDGDKKFLMHILEDESKYFKNMIFDDCYQSFLHFKTTCITLLQPDEELTESTSKHMERLTSQYIDIVKRCGYTDTVMITASFFVEIFQYVFLYWENNLTLGKIQFLKTNILYETMKLVDQISKTLIKTVIENCICCSKKCTIKKDLYNYIILKAKCTILVTKLSIKDLPENILQLINRFMEENIIYLKKIKESNCGHWTTLWSLCGRLLYNMGSTFESFYDTSTFFISLLCSSIIYFEGMHCKNSPLNIQNPLCVALYRLSNIHYKKAMYREAMTVSALHGLLSYTDKNSKAFKIWTSIKYKIAQTSSNFINISMVSCLRTDRIMIEDIGIHIDLSKYDLIELCLTEAMALKDAKLNLIEAFNSLLNELKILKANIIQRTCFMQLFGYHLLHIKENYTSDIFKNTLFELELLKDKSINILCLKANLQFFIYVNELRISNECTRIEMDNAEFALKAPKLSDNQGTYIIPAYSKINIKEDLRLMKFLKQSLKTWDEIEPNIIDVTQSWEPLLTLYILIIAAEYCRLYRYENCESKAWNLASKLSIELNNNDIFVYVTGRSLSLRQINNEWIAQAKEYANNLKDSGNETKSHIIAVFWISLADFYFEFGEYSIATKLLDDARSLPGITFQNNTAVYLYSLDTILRNYNLYKKNVEQEEYTSYIIESLYSLICLKDSLASIKWMNPDNYLCSYDILFSSTINMSALINSLLSFREITAHLVVQLKLAQALGATLRTAEILKSLCFIDLSRSRLDDCEVKLQGLEHILDTETIKLSMNTKLKQTTLESLKISPDRLIDSRRNTMQNDTSPILRRKIFNYPDFFSHINCTCILCQHVQYQYLLLASTHIRAQLYALQNNIAASLEHFHGAFKMKQKLFKVEESTLPRNFLEETNSTKKFSWQARLYITDYILLLLHFSFLLKAYIKSRKDEALKIALIAVDICETQKIESHPIYISAKELVYKYQFEEVITDQDYSSFTVPKTPEIDINKFIVQEKVSYKMCLTPVTHIQPKNPISIHRNKTPPLLKLKKININLSDEESDNSPSKLEDVCQTPVSRTKLVRRKILENEYVEDTNKSNEKTDAEKIGDISVTKIITKIAPLVPDISDHLNKITKKFDIPATNETVEKLFEMVDNLEIRSCTRQRRLRSKSASHSNESACDTEVKDSIALFKKLVISEVETNNDISNVKHTMPTIVIDNTEAAGISHKSKRTKNTFTNENKPLEKITLNNESDISEMSKSRRRVTRSTKSTKSTTAIKTTTSIKKTSSFR
ncbi:PREDICTED: uncharacterized protein LOC106789708 [Polistes canadensis]|uniref:uncharacterized protein LOC106789708 n=1 Tax=Polistes canadensis TaxID=91411 RepID=UPI000718EF92|nr:PREDICTED: uncharacterized protein LOC106789708 [Polistes canadensis]